MLLGEATITHRRPTVGSRGSDGRWTDGASTDTSILATVQVASGKDLETLPEGERSRETIKVYTENTLGFRTTNQDTGVTADLLVVDAIVYEVRRSFPQHPLIGHSKCLAVRLKEA